MTFLGIGVGLHGNPGQGGGGQPVMPNLRVATNRGEINTFAGTAMTSANNVKCCRQRHILGGDFADLILSFSNKFVPVDTSAYTETNGPQHNIRGVSVEINGVIKPVTFDGGATSHTLAAGAIDYQADTLLPSAFGLSKFSKGDTIWIKDEREYTVGTRPVLVRGVVENPAVTGESAVTGASAAASQVMTVGALTTGNGWAAYPASFGPVAVLGHPLGSDIKAVMTIGASIEYQKADNWGDGVNGAGGYVRRGLNSGAPYAQMNFSISGLDATYWMTGSHTMAVAYMKYATIGIQGLGGNDFTDAQPVAGTLTNMKAINALFKANGIKKVGQVRMSPKSDSPNDHWASLADQTVRTNTNGVGFLSFRASVDASVASDPNCDVLIDLTSAVEDAGNPGKWKVNGTANWMTTDGTHPNEPGISGMATLFRAAVDAIALP